MLAVHFRQDKLHSKAMHKTSSAGERRVLGEHSERKHQATFGTK